MSSSLEALKKRWKATGAAEDEAAYLLERVEQKDLSRAMLELAAHLGHPAAGIATGIEPLSTFRPNEYIFSLERWGKPVFILAAIAGAKAVLPYWEQAFKGNKTPRKALQATIDWFCCMCPIHARLANQAAVQSNAGIKHKHKIPPEVLARVWPCLNAAVYAAGSVIEAEATSLSIVQISVRCAREALEKNESEQKLSDIIRQALIPYALTGQSPALEPLIENQPEADTPQTETP